MWAKCSGNERITRVMEESTGIGVQVWQAEHIDREIVKMSGEELEKVNNFTYLGAVMEKNGGTNRSSSSCSGHLQQAIVQPFWWKTFLVVGAQKCNH